MKFYSSIDDIRTQVQTDRREGKTVGFVPTMGALHQGHISLVEKAKEYADKVVVSIFVNPSQFNNPEDLEKYPRKPEEDRGLLKEAGVDYLFSPAVEEIYPAGFESRVEVEGISKVLEGHYRPGHFSGVATVVSILFNAVPADYAFFGEKDFQQLALIERMVLDLHFPVSIIRCPTIREAGGLAMSSRNSRLSANGRETATAISEALYAVQIAYRKGERSAANLIAAGLSVLKSREEITIEYLEIVNEETFLREELSHSRSRVLIAAYLEGVRLIDNMPVVIAD